MAIHHIPASEIPNDRSAIDEDGFTVAVVRDTLPGHVGDWHHHGDHHVVSYLLNGTVRVESGPSGSVITEASAGDLVHLEPGTIHREIYPEGELATVGIYFGAGPGRVDVDGPES